MSLSLSGKLRLAMISPYPPPGAKHVFGSGVASYTKNLIESIKNISPNIEIHIISDIRSDAPKCYIESGINIHRVYKKNIIYIFNIFKEICLTKPEIIHFQHEYFLYGGVIEASILPLLLLFLKLLSNRVVVTIHGVIPLNLLDSPEFKRENGIRGPSFILKLGLILITKLIALLSDRLIVHEYFLKEYLIKYYKVKSQKIIIIPHGVEEFSSIPVNDAKKRLRLENKTVILYFGYLTGYKGLKDLLFAYYKVSRELPNTVLLIVGGPHPRLATSKWYQEWIGNLARTAKEVNIRCREKGEIRFTGYISEEEIPLYFSAADLVVLPYKARISASGPEALAIAFEKQYIIPKNQAECAKLDPEGISRRIINKISGREASSRTCVLKEKRKWVKIAEKHLGIYESVLK